MRFRQVGLGPGRVSNDGIGNHRGTGFSIKIAICLGLPCAGFGRPREAERETEGGRGEGALSRGSNLAQTELGIFPDHF